MREYRLSLDIGGYVCFGYSHPDHRFQDRMDRAGNQLADQMDQI